jgi:hypothetical protein
VRGNGRDLASVIRLHAADRYERVTTLSERLGDKVLELASLVAAERNAGVAVLPLCPELRATQVLRQAVQSMHRRRPE